ncbi:MAG: hypothetical protein ACOH17_04355 [Cellulomonas sp.]
MTHNEQVALDAVVSAAHLRRTADLERTRAVAAARSAGISLRAIAEVAGISISRVHQLAQLRGTQQGESPAV